MILWSCSNKFENSDLGDKLYWSFQVDAYLWEPFQLLDDPPELLSIEDGFLKEKTNNFIELEL